MASLAIHSGVASGDRLFTDQSRRGSTFNRLNSLSFPNLSVKSPLRRICSSATFTATATDMSVSDRSVSGSGIDLVPDEAFIDHEEYDSSSVSEKIDEWMMNSVAEIVKNIQQAPLLVQIYADGVVKTEKAVAAEDWPEVVSDRPSAPDGIILVEELRDRKDDNDDEEEEEGTKEFGVVIQGKFKGTGRDSRCRSACYLLKTCSVNGGMGMFCTHFCLMKVRSFSKSASSQLNDCWLLP